MIESETKLTARPGELMLALLRARQAAWHSLSRVQRQIRSVPGSPVADQVRGLSLSVGRLAGRAEASSWAGWLLRRIASSAGDRPLIHRFALHLVIVCLAVGVVALTQVPFPQVELLMDAPAPGAGLGEDLALAGEGTARGGGRSVRESMALLPAPVLHTTIPERQRTDVITYTVQPNDNLWIIAQSFGLQVETVLWANAEVEKNPDLLSVDEVLLIPPVDGVYYSVKKGDTVAKLAKTFKTSADKIVAFPANALVEPYTLTASQKLMIPGGRKPVPVVQQSLYPMTRVGAPPKGAPKGSGRFAWPTHGYLSQRYWSGHLGIDIAYKKGIPIVAADAGYILMAGRDTAGYGNQVLIDHGNGFWTRYAHLDKIHVTAGDFVQKNQQIGTMGSTGRSTGSHLHFEVILNRERRNPISYLP